MKKLLVLLVLLLCASSAAFGQETATVARAYDFAEQIFWGDSVPLVLNYTTRDAPASAPPALIAKVLGDVEARINGLNLPGLSVEVGRLDLTTSCEARTRNEVLVCWEPRQGDTSIYVNLHLTDDVDFWHEGSLILASNTVWDEALLYEWVMHNVLHFLGFGHPQGVDTSNLNGAPDLTQMDIDGLRLKFRPDRCALTYEPGGVINLPFVRYMGGAFTGKIQHNGGNDFALVPGSLGRFGSQSFNVPSPFPSRAPVPVPATPCPALEIDGNNELYIPEVKVNGVMYEGTLVLANGRFTLKSKAVK